jgi:putative thiamine transport system permease protein
VGQFHDRGVTAAAVAALALPALVIAGGQYRLWLMFDLAGTFAGLFLAHLAFVFAYVFIVLKGPYRAFDPRWRQVAHGLNATPLRFWLRIKAPLLRAPRATPPAGGFAVSMGEFVAAQLVSAGRLATLPMQAVTLAAGGDRALLAASAMVLAVPPALAFLIAHRLGRPRWSARWS